MKAFISYSVNDNDQYILTLLASKLRERNFVVTTSQNFFIGELDYTTKNEIADSHLFIGILTHDGIEYERVYSEWGFAVSKNIPTLFLIEDNVYINPSFKGNFVRFNRANPQNAINQVSLKMSQGLKQYDNSQEFLPWLLGGAALLAILSLFTNSRK